MAIRVNRKPIGDIVVGGKHISRVMHNDVQIWPDMETDENEIYITVIYKNNGYNAFCVEALEMFDKDYNKIEFDELLRIGNPDGSEDPHNVEIVLLNGDDTLANIRTDAGVYGVNPVPAKLLTTNQYHVYAYAWLPDDVCHWHNAPNEVYKGYRHYISYNGLKENQELDITVTSSGNRMVKYVAFNLGYSYNLNANTYEVLQAKFGDNYIVNYNTRQEYNTHDNGYFLSDLNVYYGARYLLGTDGSINKYWHLNYYSSNSPNLFDIFICKQWYLVNENDEKDKTLALSNVVPSTIKEIVNGSDHNGHIIIEKPKRTDISITTERIFSNNQAFSTLCTVLLYDENGNMINNADMEWSSVTAYNGGLASTSKSVVTGFFNNDEDLISIHCDKGQYGRSYTALQSLGIPDEDAGEANYNYVFGCTGSVPNPGSVVNYRLLSTVKVRYISIPLKCSPTRAATDGFSKLTINGNIVKEYSNTEKALYDSSEAKINHTYVRRYTYDLETGDIYVSYVKANGLQQTINTFRKHYVYDTFTNTCKEITFEELLTGNYPDGEYSSLEDFSKFTFAFSGPAYTSTIGYTAMQYLRILNRDGSIYGSKGNVLKEATANGKVPYEDFSVVELSNKEIIVLHTDAGVHSSGYLLSYVLANGINDVYLTGNNAVNGFNLNTGERRVSIYLPDDKLLVLFTPWWRYATTMHYTTCKKLTYDNNNDQVLKDYTSWADTANEVKVVKGVTYYRLILATIEKAYIVWCKDVNGSLDFFKYNEDFDTMLKYTVEEIIDKDLVEENDTDVTKELENRKSDVIWNMVPNYNPVYGYFAFCNGIIYIEDTPTTDSDGNMTSAFKKVNPDTLTSILYKRDTKFGKDENDSTALIRFKDEDGNIYDMSTDAGTYNNSNSYHLWNLFSNVNYDNTAAYGYLTWYPYTNILDRLFKFRLQSTAKVKAICFQCYYIGGYGRGTFPDSHFGKMVYDGKTIFEYSSEADAKAVNYVESMYERFIIFPEKSMVLKVRTPNKGLATQTGVIQTPHYLWERNLQVYVEFTIDELYEFDQDRNNYDFNTASFATPRPEVNSMSFKVAKTFKFTTELYAEIGNCILYDEEYNMIPVKWKSYTRNILKDTPYSILRYFCVWEDDDGNEYEIETDCFEYTGGTYEHAYSLANVFTPYYDDVKTGNARSTTAAGPNSMWLSRNGLLSTPDANGNPTKWGNIKIRAATKKIAAIGISEAYYYYNGINRYIFSHLIYQKDKDTSIPIWEYNSSAASYTADGGRFKVINSVGYFKRTILLEDGTQYVTWIRYRGPWNHTE